MLYKIISFNLSNLPQKRYLNNSYLVKNEEKLQSATKNEIKTTKFIFI